MLHTSSLFALALILFVITFIVLSAAKLMRYIGEVEAGRKVALPDLGKNEFGTLGRALEAMRSRLEGKEYVEQLMHTLAHELKSPIAAIQASAELLQEDMPPAERRQFLASILEQNARQRQLIDKLLALVRVEKQQRLEHPERIALAPLLAQVAQDAAATLAARGVRLQLAAEDLAVAGDALLLRQALGNLLDNAAGFAPPGSSIDLTARRHGGQVEIGVRDRGEGIPAYALERVFERFYSLPRPASGKSTGLGLPFVREVAALHDGTVEVVNHAEGGACARLRLPLA